MKRRAEVLSELMSSAAVVWSHSERLSQKLKPTSVTSYYPSSNTNRTAGGRERSIRKSHLPKGGTTLPRKAYRSD